MSMLSEADAIGCVSPIKKQKKQKIRTTLKLNNEVYNNITKQIYILLQKKLEIEKEVYKLKQAYETIKEKDSVQCKFKSNLIIDMLNNRKAYLTNIKNKINIYNNKLINLKNNLNLLIDKLI